MFFQQIPQLTPFLRSTHALVKWFEKKLRTRLASPRRCAQDETELDELRREWTGEKSVPIMRMLEEEEQWLISVKETSLF